MRTIKIIYLTPLFILFLAMAANAGQTGLSAGTASELKAQLGDEIREVLQVPYLRYSTEELSGEIIVEATVTDEGRIVLRGLKGENENLRENIYGRFTSMNLWTNPDLANTLLRYKIKYTD